MDHTDSTPAQLSGEALLAAARQAAVDLLRHNLTRHGVMAASPSPEAEARRYTRIFGRDHAICALGMATSGELDLLEGAVDGLVLLARHQAGNGQIPKYVDPQEKEADFWYVGCIDATLWWLIAVRLLDQLDPHRGLQQRLQGEVDKALVWLHCQEHPRLRLLQQNEASDWADIMPRSGFVLYTNVLWDYLKRLYGLAHQQATRYHFQHLFFPFSEDVPAYRRLRLLRDFVRREDSNQGLYLSFVNFAFWGEEGDVLGNLLAIVLGVAGEGRSMRILRALRQAQADACGPVRAVCAPIEPETPLWRTYMERHGQNLPYQYHNGGVWPFIGGFWVMALRDMGQPDAAQTALVELARLNAMGNWGFQEWFHGRTGELAGMRGQSWNAATYLLAERCVYKPDYQPFSARYRQR